MKPFRSLLGNPQTEYQVNPQLLRTALMIQSLLRYRLLLVVLVFAVTNFSASAQEETGSSAVPLLEGKSKPKPVPSSTTIGRPIPAPPPVKAIGKVKITTGVIYSIDSNGELLWNRNEGWNDGSMKWADNHGRIVGHGWNVKHVFAGDNGVIYTINDNNELIWYRHDGRGDGSFKWADNAGRKVGHGWNVKHVFSGGNGVIYAINDNDELVWYRHDGRGDGSFKWADNNGRIVGTGWTVKHVFAP
ncbi:MAG TPA: tachylectin-related carbohydrate-binding protein [Chthoniobacterales bacterium]